MSETWEERPLNKTKLAIMDIEESIKKIKMDIKKSSNASDMDLLQKIDVIEDWYALHHIVCKEKEYKCENCPFLEMTTTEWDDDLKEYDNFHYCKFEFGSGYAGDIIPYIEKYRDKISTYKADEDRDERESSREWKWRFER